MNTAFPADPAPVPAPVPRILVVDDTPDNLFLMNGLFEDRFQVLQAASGLEALKIVMSDAPPDMVLLDIMMPDMDGYEVLRRIRQHPPTANLPVIFLTALAGPHDERLGMNLGAVDYLTKPVNPELVIQRVEAHVLATAHTRRMEALSEKLSRHLLPEAWQQLFHGADLETITFKHKSLTVLCIEAALLSNRSARERDGFAAEVEWLAARHAGTVERFVFESSIIFFDEPGPCVRLALDLQHSSADLGLQMGIHSAPADLAFFQSAGRSSCTLLGAETNPASMAAVSAVAGSIVISPETYALVQGELLTDIQGYVLTEERHGPSRVSAVLTRKPVRPLRSQAQPKQTA